MVQGRTSTLTVSMVVPTALVQLKVKSVLVVGDALSAPFNALAPDQPPLAVHGPLVQLASQLSVVVSSTASGLGSAENTMKGGSAAPTQEPPPLQ
jgi:hypothetical protein